MAKGLAGIIFPLVGQSQHHLKNTQHFIQKIQQVRLEQGEVISSYDVKVLFTSVPVDPAINIVKQRLTQDPTLPQMTQMSIPQIVTLLQFCFKNTYFLFQGKYYEQVHGAAMGSPISPLIDNLLMKEFEVKALQSAPHPPCMWIRFVYDTLVFQKAEHSQQLLHLINSQDPYIQFTVEKPSPEGLIPFLDTKVTPGPNNTIITTVYRKPAHTDQYLHWDSNHFITAKNSVYNTLAHRAKVVSSTPEDLTKELDHLKKALMACQCPNWTLNRLQQQFELKHNLNNGNIQTEDQTNDNNMNNNSSQQNKNISIVIPYIQGLGEKFLKVQQTRHSSTFQSTNTVKQLLMAPNDEDPKLAKSGILYRYKCSNINCREQYIGESGRTLGDRYKECLKAPSPIHLHTSSAGHPVSPECFSIVDREAQGLARNMKKAMYINDPSLNRNLGKFQLPMGPGTKGHTFTAPQVEQHHHCNSHPPYGHSPIHLPHPP